MRAAGQDEEAVRAFARAYERLVGGESALIGSDELEPVAGAPALESWTRAPAGALDHVAVIKLNGGLATTMGLRRAKSLMEARDGRSFLELIVGQTLALRGRYGARLPLVLMDSDATGADARALGDSELRSGAAARLRPEHDPEARRRDARAGQLAARAIARVAPPGHGDVYGALRRSGMLARCWKKGFATR